MANYCCPSCDGRLQDAGVINAFRCRRCGQRVAEAVDGAQQRVRSFYRRATERRWGGLRG